MSTRTIIAMQTETGTYESAWCWNDGFPSILGRDLRRYFKTADQVHELLQTKSFSLLSGPIQVLKYVREGDKVVHLRNGRCLLLHPKDGHVVAGEGSQAEFLSVQDMLQEDLNYVYIFENGKWQTWK